MTPSKPVVRRLKSGIIVEQNCAPAIITLSAPPTTVAKPLATISRVLTARPLYLAKFHARGMHARPRSVAKNLQNHVARSVAFVLQAQREETRGHNALAVALLMIAVKPPAPSKPLSQPARWKESCEGPMINTNVEELNAQQTIVV